MEHRGLCDEDNYGVIGFQARCISNAILHACDPIRSEETAPLIPNRLLDAASYLITSSSRLDRRLIATVVPTVWMSHVAWARTSGQLPSAINQNLWECALDSFKILVILSLALLTI